MSAVESLLAGGAQVTAWDNREEPRRALEGRVELADPVGIDLTGFAGVVVSPGVPLNQHPIAAHAASFGVPVIGDIELFALARPNLPAHRVVGITGTNGKSTTTALLHHILQSAALPTRMGGNIGLPILSANPLDAGGVYVLELSSYQLDLTHSLQCEVAALLNVTPDHLDRYDGFTGYAASKARLFAMQRADQFAVFGMGDARTQSIAAREAQLREAWRVRSVDGKDLIALQDDWPSAARPAQSAKRGCGSGDRRSAGADPDAVAPGLGQLSRAATPDGAGRRSNGVMYINDSKATNPASTAPALAAFPPRPERRIHWILGGLPKGDRLDECAPFFGNVAAAYTIGEAGPKFADLLTPFMPVRRSEMMCEAIQQAMAAAKPGDVVLLSPACASFDQFRDYEARGDAFRQIVQTLLTPEPEITVGGRR
jgi:UDP-N-acetylmuramoylalanine--D-glutamate ligase